MDQPPPFSTILSLLPTSPALLNPMHAHSKPLNAEIAAASVHPTLEAALHILNNDLASAHFLVRKMQAPPAYEGMMLHAILHRIEGDYDNARAWVDIVHGCELFTSIWPTRAACETLIDDIEARRNTEECEKESEREMQALLRHCEVKFGTGVWQDARSEWVDSREDSRKMMEDMVTGGKQRNF